MEDMERRSNCASISLCLLYEALRSSCDVWRLSRTVNAGELERLKKRFMKLDRCAVHFLPCRSKSGSTLTHVPFDASFYPRHPSCRNIASIVLHPDSRYQSSYLPTDLNGPMYRGWFHLDIAMARVRSTEMSSCRSPRLLETPWHQG